MSKNKDEETHVSILRDTHGKLKAIAKAERRSMRTVLVAMVDTAYNKLMEKK